MSGGLTLVLLLAVVARSRRAEAGLYRAIGAGTCDMMVMAFIEASLLVMPMVALGALWACAFHVAATTRDVRIDELLVAVRAAAQMGSLVVAIGPLPWLVYGRGAISAQLRIDWQWRTRTVLCAWCWPARRHPS